MIKQRRESIEMYEKGGREELAEAEAAEVAVIEDFLPSQMSDDEIGAAIDALVAETGAARQGHGPGDGADEGAPRRPARHEQGERRGEGEAVRMAKRGSVTLSPHFLDELRAADLALGADRAHGEAAARRARVEGLLSVPQRKDAELHRQRRERLLPLLRLRRAWRRDPLADRPRGLLHGRGQGARRRGRDGGPRPRPAAPGARPSGRRACARSWRRPRAGSPSSSDGSGGGARDYL